MEYLDNKVVAVLVVESLETLSDKVANLLEKGYDVLEVTLRTEHAFEAIKYIKERYPHISVGAGTVLTKEQLKSCQEAGADFGVAPGLNSEIIQEAKNSGFDFIPGVATPSEIEEAMSLGIKLVKLFPANILGGTDYIKALSGPYSDMKFMPTGGINSENYLSYLSLSSVTCVGGTWMF